MREDILGVRFHNVTLEEAVTKGAELVGSQGFHYVVTPNPEIVNLARQSEDYQEILNGADLVLPDGIGVVYAAKLLGTPLKGRVPGIDFATGLMARLAQSGDGLFLLGAKPGVARTAAERLRKTFPGLKIVGTHDGYFQDDQAMVEEIGASGAKVCFVCLGAPKQEKWMVKFGPSTGVSLMAGLGGVLDVFSGNARRAPEAWQRLGLEWCYRLLHQPSRLGRMAKLPGFLVAAAAARGKRS